MNHRQHAIAAINAWVRDVPARDGLVKAVEHEIALAVQTERDRCMAWTQLFDTHATQWVVQGIQGGESPPGH